MYLPSVVSIIPWRRSLIGMKSCTNSSLNTYGGQSMRDAREVLARCKDWLMCIFKPEPTYLGEAIPVSGNGDLTND